LAVTASLGPDCRPLVGEPVDITHIITVQSGVWSVEFSNCKLATSV
jgi:hypothetical protein